MGETAAAGWTLTDLPTVSLTDDEAHPPRRSVSLPSRRVVATSVLASMASVGWTTMKWGLPAAYAETGPGGLLGWDRNDCTDAYPSGYAQQAATDGSGWAAACFGSSRIGPSWCTSSTNGWSRSGTVSLHNGWDRYTPATTACKSKNAWRWTTSSIKYRCSDGHYTYNRLGTTYGPYLYQCQSKV